MEDKETQHKSFKADVEKLKERIPNPLLSEPVQHIFLELVIMNEKLYNHIMNLDDRLIKLENAQNNHGN